MSKTNKEFEERWNNICRKFRFLCCCQCEMDENKEPIPNKIEIAKDKNGDELNKMMNAYNKRNERWD